MSTAANAVLDLLEGMFPDWQIQFARWDDTGAPSHRFIVLRPAGGPKAELIREPQFTVAFIGRDGGDRMHTSDAADRFVESLRTYTGTLIDLQPGEPVYTPTEDGRPVFEMAVSALTD